MTGDLLCVWSLCRLWVRVGLVPYREAGGARRDGHVAALQRLHCLPPPVILPHWWPYSEILSLSLVDVFFSFVHLYICVLLYGIVGIVCVVCLHCITMA